MNAALGQSIRKLGFPIGRHLLWTLLLGWVTTPILRAQIFNTPRPVFVLNDHCLSGGGTQTIDLTTDIDGDGLSDVRLGIEAMDDPQAPPGQSPSRRFVEPAVGTRVIGATYRTSTNFCLTQVYLEPGPAVVGQIIDSDAPPVAPPVDQLYRNWFQIYNWHMGDDLALKWIGGNDLYLGLVITSGDGPHAAWVHYLQTGGAWTVAGFSWDPIPHRKLAVGSDPTGPGTEIVERSRYIPATASVHPDILGDPIVADIPTSPLRLWLREWTNRVDRSHGLDATVQGATRWLVQTGSRTNLAAGLPARSIPPGQDNNARVWRDCPLGVVFYSESIDSNGVLSATGPLATNNPAFGVFDGGWAKLDRSTWTLTSAKATAVGAPAIYFSPGSGGWHAAQWTMMNVANLDVEGDGLVDFLDVTEVTEGWFLFPDQITSTTYHYLIPLDGSSAASDTSHPPVIGSGTTWTRDIFQYYPITNSESLFGVQVITSDGVHYGWIRYNQSGFTTRAMNPWPGEGIVAGSPAPAPLRIAIDSNGSPLVNWPVSMSVNLERYAIDGDHRWTPVTPTTPGRFEASSGINSALFRLR